MKLARSLAGRQRVRVPGWDRVMRKCRRNCRRTKPHKAVPDNESDRPSKLGNDAEAIERAKRCFKGPCPLGGGVLQESRVDTRYRAGAGFPTESLAVVSAQRARQSLRLPLRASRVGYSSLTSQGTTHLAVFKLPPDSSLSEWTSKEGDTPGDQLGIADTHEQTVWIHTSTRPHPLITFCRPRVKLCSNSTRAGVRC